MLSYEQEGNFYNVDGEPRHFGAGGRRKTVKDAAKEGLFPSSTTINKTLDAPALNNWKVSTAIKTAFNHPRFEDEKQEDYVRRISSTSWKENSGAAQFGTAFHKAAEDYFSGKPMDENFRVFLEPIIKWKQEKELDFVKLEHTFAFPEYGYGGCIDVCAKNPSGQMLIIDYKTRSNAKPGVKMRPYGMEIVQIGSYAASYWGVDAVESKQVHGVNIFVSVTEPGKIDIHGYTPEEVLSGWELFKAITEVWFRIKNYDPRKN